MLTRTLYAVARARVDAYMTHKSVRRNKKLDMGWDGNDAFYRTQGDTLFCFKLGLPRLTEAMTELQRAIKCMQCETTVSVDSLPHRKWK